MERKFLLFAHAMAQLITMLGEAKIFHDVCKEEEKSSVWKESESWSLRTNKNAECFIEQIGYFIRIMSLHAPWAFRFSLSHDFGTTLLAHSIGLFTNWLSCWLCCRRLVTLFRSLQFSMLFNPLPVLIIKQPMFDMLFPLLNLNRLIFHSESSLRSLSTSFIHVSMCIIYH